MGRRRQSVPLEPSSRQVLTYSHTAFHLTTAATEFGAGTVCNSHTEQCLKSDRVHCKSKVVPVLQLSTTTWGRIGEGRYSSTHS
jgi:hypothetical protein